MQRLLARRQIAGSLGLLSGAVVVWPLWCLAFDPAASTEFSLSQETRYCLNCHDGASAALIHRSHPVDISYLFAQIRSNGKLKPPTALNPAIYLKDDQLICVSCHHPESQNPAKLVMDNTGSMLCLACHNL
jgi:predicted CXXCH cytochrome family protein